MTLPLTSIARELIKFVPASQTSLHQELESLTELSDLPESDQVPDTVDDLHEALGYCNAALSILQSQESEVSGNTSNLFAMLSDYFADHLRTRIREKVRGIYIIVDPDATNGLDVYDMTRLSLEGGVGVVQYRDKGNDRDVILDNCYRIKGLCNQYGAAFVVNDAADVARLTEADFLHLGQSDLPVNGARKVLHSHQAIGRSNGGLSEAKESESLGVDYLAVGAIYATSTMGKSSRRPLGPSALIEVKLQTTLPVVAIGGITKDNLSEVIGAGADAACIVSAITMADDPEHEARHLVNLWDSQK